MSKALEEIRSKAGRERAMRELEALRDQISKENFSFESDFDDLRGFSRSLAEEILKMCQAQVGRRIDEIAKEGV